LIFSKADSQWVQHSHLHIHYITIDSCNWQVQLNLYIKYEPLKIHEGLTYMEEPVKIVDKEQVLRTKTIPIIKVVWRNHGLEEASWEAEHDMWSRYPHLFE
jgi:hypothetical protein